MAITLLSINGEYADRHVSQSTNLNVYEFLGQPKGGRDHWIEPGSILIRKRGNYWEYQGVVLDVDKMLEPLNGVARFLLVVERNMHTGRMAPTKKLLMEKIGWLLNDEAPGIARVTHL